MGKAKGSKDNGKIPNKAVHSRVSYLFQAATYLATQQQQHSKIVVESSTEAESNGITGMAEAEMRPPFESKASVQPALRRLISDVRAVSLKAQMRMSPAMKHSICKNCDTFLVDGYTCTSEVENKSKGGKKAWADILVRRCDTCSTAKRFPVAAERQKRLPQRSANGPKTSQEANSADD